MRKSVYKDNDPRPRRRCKNNNRYKYGNQVNKEKLRYITYGRTHWPNNSNDGSFLTRTSLNDWRESAKRLQFMVASSPLDNSCTIASRPLLRTPYELTTKMTIYRCLLAPFVHRHHPSLLHETSCLLSPPHPPQVPILPPFSMRLWNLTDVRPRKT